MGFLAMVVDGPALPDNGFKGVDVPVVVVESGGRRVDREVLESSDGN